MDGQYRNRRSRCAVVLGALLLGAGILLGGCGGASGDVKGGEPSPSPAVRGYHSPASIGNAGQPSQGGKPREFTGVKEFAAATNKWFGGQGLSYVISGDLVGPGDEIGITIRAEERDKAQALVELAGEIRFKLTERKSDGSYVGTVDERVERVESLDRLPLYQVRVPKREGMLYFLTAEILIKGKVEDTLFSYVEVPLQQVEAELVLNDTKFAAAGVVQVTLTNKGASAISTGTDYSMERKVGETWLRVPLEPGHAFPAMLLTVGQGETWSISVNFRDLEPGVYRIGKHVSARGTSIEKTVCAEFMVE